MIFTFEITLSNNSTSLNATELGYKVYGMWLRLRMAFVNIYVSESGFILLYKALGKAAAGRHWTVKQAT